MASTHLQLVAAARARPCLARPLLSLGRGQPGTPLCARARQLATRVTCFQQKGRQGDKAEQAAGAPAQPGPQLQPAPQSNGQQQPWVQDPGWGSRSYQLNHLAEAPAPQGLEQALPNAGQPSMVSRDRSCPQGAYPEAHMTPMQSHVAFFDDDGDGVIWPGDTYRGFRRVGFSRSISALAVPIIHGAFSYATLPPGRWLPDPLFRVNINHIHKAKHGSDSETYDTEGRWVAQKFEEIFSKYGRTYPDALTWEELEAMCKGNKNAADFFGWTAEKLEWYITYLLVADPVAPGGPKVLRRDDARGILDGTLFYRIEDSLKSGDLQRRGATEAGFKQGPRE